MPKDTRFCEISGSRGATDEDLSFTWYSHECLPYQAAQHTRRVDFFFYMRLETRYKEKKRGHSQYTYLSYMQNSYMFRLYIRSHHQSGYRINFIVLRFILSCKVLYPA